MQSVGSYVLYYTALTVLYCVYETSLGEAVDKAQGELCWLQGLADGFLFLPAGDIGKGCRQPGSRQGPSSQYLGPRVRREL